MTTTASPTRKVVQSAAENYFMHVAEPDECRRLAGRTDVAVADGRERHLTHVAVPEPGGGDTRDSHRAAAAGGGTVPAPSRGHHACAGLSPRTAATADSYSNRSSNHRGRNNSPAD